MYYIKDCLRFGIEEVQRDLRDFFVTRNGKRLDINLIYVIKDYNEAKKKTLVLYDNAILRLNKDIEIMYEKIDKKKANIDVMLNSRRQLC